MGNDELIIKPKRPKGEEGYKVFSIRVKEEIVIRLMPYLERQAEAGMS